MDIKTVFFYFLLVFLASPYLWAQNETLAKEYYDKGEFAKAEAIYKTLYEKEKNNTIIFDLYLATLQAEEKLEEIQEIILNYLEENSENNYLRDRGKLYVLLGSNYEKKDSIALSKKYYQMALDHLKEAPAQGFLTAKTFHEVQQLDFALESYQFMMQAFPTANYYHQIATIYGEKGNVEKMFDTYLDMMEAYQNDISNVHRFLMRFLSDDSQDKNNILLRKLLVNRIRINPQFNWYKTLSWLYINQKEYSKALIQEKAIFTQKLASVDGVIALGILAFEEMDYPIAIDAFRFVMANDSNSENIVTSHYYVFESMKRVCPISTSRGMANSEFHVTPITNITFRHMKHDVKDLEELEKGYTDFFNTFPNSIETLAVQISYANFLAFYQNNPEKALQQLEALLDFKIDRFQAAEIKIQIADIMVFNHQYNKALIYYTQVQNTLKNHTLAQTARFKVARTSYFKADFEWANAQLKVLKKGTTKLIANDALELSMLISDNIAEDSIQTALKRYAHADLLAFQNKDKEAIDSLNVLLKNFKGHPIEDEALFKQASLYEKTGNPEKAAENYLAILNLAQDDLLHDDASYALAVLYDTSLMDELKAKEYYEKIILEYPSSIYLVTARNRFRELRGDDLVP